MLNTGRLVSSRSRLSLWCVRAIHQLCWSVKLKGSAKKRVTRHSSQNLTPDYSLQNSSSFPSFALLNCSYFLQSCWHYPPSWPSSMVTFTFSSQPSPTYSKPDTIFPKAQWVWLILELGLGPLLGFFFLALRVIALWKQNPPLEWWSLSIGYRQWYLALLQSL